MLTNKRKTELALELATFREDNESFHQKRRLVSYPFIEAHGLFGLNPDTDHFPCTTFGRQLILKIIDELLDTERRLSNEQAK